MYRPPVSKEKYYYHAAKRFMMDAQLLRCRAAIHVEDKDDIVFWSNIFKHFRPNDRFHFIAGSRNERGHETRGVTQCLKYVKYLNPKFFICIDSDYRYLLQEQGIDVKHYIFQTYTYSFENHHCYDKGLNELCYRITAQRVRLPSISERVFEYRVQIIPVASLFLGGRSQTVLDR